MDIRKTLVITSILIFLVMIPLALLNQVHGWIPDLIIFILLALFYYWTWDHFRMTPQIFTLLIIGHVLHACGIFGWYHISPVPIAWERITHFFGALPFALLFFRWMEPSLTSKWLTKKNLLILLAVFLMATGVGAIVELSEFLGYLSLGFGEGGLMFGPGDGISGLEGSDLIDALGGGWINEGWDFIYNTIGIIVGMAIMLLLRVFRKPAEKAYYFEPTGEYSRKV